MDEKGEITHFIAIKQDITERKQADQALGQNEELLRKVLETLPIGVWITDASGNLMQGNPESRRIWQGARFVGIDQYGEYKGWWLDSGERIEPEQWAAARAVTRGETSLNEEIEIECFDGSHKIIFNSAVPILDERNVVQGVIVVNQDITERKQAEESIHLERSKLRNILDTMPEGICIIGQKYDIEYINPSLEREFGQVGRSC